MLTKKYRRMINHDMLPMFVEAVSNLLGGEAGTTACRALLAGSPFGSTTVCFLSLSAENMPPAFFLFAEILRVRIPSIFMKPKMTHPFG